MKRRRFALHSPAMCVAPPALIVALVGTAYASGFGPFNGDKVAGASFVDDFADGNDTLGTDCCAEVTGVY